MIPILLHLPATQHALTSLIKPQPRLALQDVSNQTPVRLPPIRDSQAAQGDDHWQEELAEVRKAADSLRTMYRDVAVDDLRHARTPQERRTALLKSATTSDEHEPVMNSAFALLQANNKKAISTAKAKSAAASKKRKPETTLEEDIAAYKQNLDHIDVDDLDIDENCDQVRKQINQVLDNAIMKKGEFCNAIGSSNHSVNTFLQKRGPIDGLQSETYTNAWAWFKQRELAGLKMPDVKKRQKAAAATAGDSSAAAGPVAKKSKTSVAQDATLDLSNIHLPGEETDSVPVFDSCDEIRKKISAHLKTPGLTQAQFCRDLYAQLRAPTCKSIQTKQLNDFRGKKGARAGCTSSVFYAAYVYFEKMRIAKGKPKSVHRLQMEVSWEHMGGLGREPGSDGRHG